MTSGLDISSLENAVAQLKRSYAQAEKERATEGVYFQSLRTACIKGFELVYDLSIKFLLRELEEREANTQTAEKMVFRDMLRLASEKGLIADPEQWFTFRQERNQTAHTYDEKVAQEFYLRIPVYIQAAEQLLAGLKR